MNNRRYWLVVLMLVSLTMVSIAQAAMNIDSSRVGDALAPRLTQTASHTATPTSTTPCRFALEGCGQDTPTPTATPNPNIEELAINGDFETDTDANDVPDTWTGINLSKDKRKCNTLDKIFAAVGSCAFQFKGVLGENSRLTQNLDTTLVFGGDTITLRLQAKTNITAAGTIASVIIKTVDGSKSKIKITLGVPTVGYESKVSAVTVGADATTMKVQLRLTTPSGKLLIDDLHVELELVNARHFGG